MSCEKNTKTCIKEYAQESKCGIDYLIVVVLYILLVIILSACLYR